MNTLVQDIRYALRQLRKSPGFTLTAVLTLALGIGANSTIFSWIDSTLFDPIPGVARTGNMVTLQRGERSEHPTPPFSYADYVDLRDNAKSFSGVLAYHDDYMAITGGARPERVYGVLASANYFEVLGVKPALGGTLISTMANEREGAPVVVLGYDLWQSRFGGDPGIIGKTTQINLHTYTIAGVAPRGFQGCKSGLRAELFLPLGMDRQIWDSTRIDERGASWLQLLGVMRPGVDAHQAENELNLLMGRIVGRFPETHQGANRISTDPLWRSPYGSGRGVAAAGLRQCRESSAGAHRLAPPRVCHSPLLGSDSLEAGSPAHGGESSCRPGRLRSCIGRHLLDGQHDQFLFACHHASAQHPWAGQWRGDAGHDSHFRSDGRDFRSGSSAARFRAVSRDRAEG
jgi:hypothetical protein